MRNVTPDEGTGRLTSPGTEAGLLANLLPRRMLERDGQVVGFWYAVAVRVPQPEDGTTQVSVTIVGAARTVDGRSVGVETSLPLDPNLPFEVLRRFSHAARPADDAGTHEAARAFVSALRSMGSLLASVADPSRSLPFQGAIRHALTALLGWEPGLEDLRKAARDYAGLVGRDAGSFLSTLDPCALDLVPRLRAVDGALGLAWPGLDRTFDPDAPLAAAMRARPWHARLLLEAWTTRGGEIRAFTAGGDDVVARLAADFVPSASVRADRLREIEASLGGTSPRRSLSIPCGENPALVVLHGTARIADGDLPRDAPGWQAFTELLPMRDALAGWQALTDPIGLLVGSGEDWAGRRDAIAAAARTRDPHDAIGRLDRMARACARQVLMPAVALARGRDPEVGPATWEAWDNAAHSMLFSARSLLAMLGAASDWDASRHPTTSLDGTAGGKRGRSWEALLPPARYHRMSLRAFTDEASLRAMGPALPMRADVLDALVEDCAMGRMRVVRVEREEGAGEPAPVSLAVFSVSQRPVALRGHAGLRGASPQQDAVNALSRYRRDLREGRLALSGDGLATPRHRVTVSALAGYDHHDHEAWAETRTEWDRFLPPPMQGAEAWQLARLAGRHMRPGPRHWHGHMALPRSMARPGPEDPTRDGHASTIPGP